MGDAITLLAIFWRSAYFAMKRNWRSNMFRWIALLTLSCTATLAATDFEIVAENNDVSKAKFTEPDSQKHHHFRFRQGYVLGTYTQKLQAPAALTYGVGYMKSHFHFSHHPKKTSFREQNFNNLLLQFGAATDHIEHWHWNAGIGAQINTEHFKTEYTFFDGVLHGAYDFEQDTRLHVGIVGYTGLRYTRVLPLIGFDKKLSDKWQLNAVFPVNMALIYQISDHFSFDAAIRYMLSRQRLSKNEHYRKGFVAYRNWGAEAGINYIYNEHFRVNLHVGESFAGRIRISNKNDSHRRHLKLDAALYYGLSANIAF